MRRAIPLALKLMIGAYLMCQSALPVAPARLHTTAPVPVSPSLLKAAEWWLGIYLGENKLGYTHVTSTPVQTDGERRLRVCSTTLLRTTVMGYAVEQQVSTTEMLDASLRPITLDVRISSAGRHVDVSARFHADRVTVERWSDSEVTRKELPIPKGANLVADAETALFSRQVQPGETWRYTYLNYLTLTLEEAQTKVLRRETITVGGTRYETVVAETSSPVGDATVWLLEDGQPVKMQMAPGLTLLRTTREEALANLEERPYDPGLDLANQTAVRVQGTIEHPGRTQFLRMKIRGIPERRFVLSDARQQVHHLQEQEGNLSAEYVVDATAELPPTPLTPAERAALVAPGAYLPVDHPEIQAKAREATADANEDSARVQALWRWVHETMRVQGDIGIPRSALEVLREPVGMCRDYAILYAALARALNIPTRLCAGIVHSRGHFYYHAWAESYVDGRWVPVDPTVPPGFVDATHIKFAEGDVGTIYGAVKIVGRLEAEILEQRAPAQ